MPKQTASFFHPGHRKLQDKFDGRRMADALAKHRRFNSFRDEDKEFIQQSEFFFLATAALGSVDCSFKGGAPGFVKVTGPATLEWSDYDGNSMYRSLGNILQSPRVGMLFIRFGGSPRRLRVNGEATVIENSDAPDLILVVRVVVDSIFPNCPRYIPDIQNDAPSPYLPSKGQSGKKPVWKDAKDLRDALPQNDPHKN